MGFVAKLFHSVWHKITFPSKGQLRSASFQLDIYSSWERVSLLVSNFAFRSDIYKLSIGIQFFPQGESYIYILNIVLYKNANTKFSISILSR